MGDRILVQDAGGLNPMLNPSVSAARPFDQHLNVSLNLRAQVQDVYVYVYMYMHMHMYMYMYMRAQVQDGPGALLARYMHLQRERVEPAHPDV